MIKSQWGWIFNGGSIFCHFVTVLYDLSALQGKYSNCLRHERCIGADNYAKQVTIQAGHRDYWDGTENTERKRVNRLCALSVFCETLRVLCVPKQIPKQNIWHKVGTRITFDEGWLWKSKPNGRNGAVDANHQHEPCWSISDVAALYLYLNQWIGCARNTRSKGPVLIGAGFNENR